MQKNWVTGFPRIGEQRELKKALESYWSGKSDIDALQSVAKELKARHWSYQQEAGIEFISSNDFSYYDLMLDMSVTLGVVPKRFGSLQRNDLYFAMARGTKEAVACEMTKWFNTNYHYIVPELEPNQTFSIDASKIIDEYNEAKTQGVQTKINLIGPITYLGLAKRVDGGDTFVLHAKIVEAYKTLLGELANLDESITIQIEEPYFVKDLEPKILSLIKPTYDALANVSNRIKIAVVTYFESANEAVEVLVHTPIWAIGLDFVYGDKNIDLVETIAKSDKTLIAGIIDGRNIWKSDIKKKKEFLETIAAKIPKERIIPSTSCSLLHVPYTLKYETKMDSQIKSWLAYALEKLQELQIVTKLFFGETLSQEEQENLLQNTQALQNRKTSTAIHDPQVQQRVDKLQTFEREMEFEKRIKLQHEILRYKPLVTTTIGSFPQTQEVRQARRELKNGTIDETTYKQKMREYIDECIKIQEECDLEVLVHGEPERNDMVEYFGEQLKGYGFSQNGWVQSYGSRCVKPPFIYGDISRPKPMTIEWITYAQSKTDKVVKGMLTGPVTILNWSFVRDDIERSEVSKQIALAIKDEVDDLQKAGIKIIQVDEAAFKEGYPLKTSKIPEYESWAVRDFKIAVSSAKPTTQIHTHMCYSEFNDIIETIEAMDADVISIETARSGNELLKIFAKSGYKQEVGPGVYDIHSPRIPSVEEIVKQIEALLEVLPKEQLWINPDCGLKTRKWEEVVPSLKNMTQAVRIVRNKLGV